jgi:photosystem II stability/assembly factor-like uncharacterized protein
MRSIRPSRTLARVLCAAGVMAATASSFSSPVPARASQPPGWTLVFNRPFAGKYEDLAFPDSKNGWLVSAAGQIFHTSDGGTTWTQQAEGMPGLRSIDFLDDHRGFAGTLTGKLYGTTDGGVRWTDITNSLPKTARGFCGMTHVGDQVHIVGRYIYASDYFFSPDGGRTWRASDLGTLAQGLVEVQFLNQSVGLIGGMSAEGPASAGPATILKTIDGGRTWRTVFRDNGGRGFAWKIVPVSKTMIYAALQSQDGTYRIAKSIDAGDTWNVHIVATGRTTGPAVQGIGFIDERTGFVGGFFSGMYTTTDGGETWSALSVMGGTYNRFEKVGDTLITAGTSGVMRYERR